MARNEDDELLVAVEALRTSRGWSQAQLGQAIGASQGHVSKVLGKKVVISRKSRVRLTAIIGPGIDYSGDISALEEEVVAAIRASPAFRDLVSAALKMHEVA